MSRTISCISETIPMRQVLLAGNTVHDVHVRCLWSISPAFSPQFNCFHCFSWRASGSGSIALRLSRHRTNMLLRQRCHAAAIHLRYRCSSGILSPFFAVAIQVFSGMIKLYLKDYSPFSASMSFLRARGTSGS